LELAFEVAGTKEIKTWIMGFGSLAKALEPASLVKEIKDDLKKPDDLAQPLEACRLGKRNSKACDRWLADSKSG
jgi:hypothetical protein